MAMMQIYVPSRGRVEAKQTTLEQLTKEMRKRTTVVVNHEEGDLYAENGWMSRYWEDGVKLMVCDKRAKHIGDVRQAIIDSHDIGKHGPKILMLDDDLRFFIRRTDDPTKFYPCEEHELVACIKDVESTLDHYAHGSILAREGGNRIAPPYSYNSRMLRALAYRVDIMKQHDVRFDRLTVMEDFDVALQLLELGYQARLTTAYVQDQQRSGAPGGCSNYRTLEKQAEGAHGLRALHPKYVFTVVKTTKTAWDGATRTDVQVEWKRAFASYKGEPRAL